jgi:hypothetical protein
MTTPAAHTWRAARALKRLGAKQVMIVQPAGPEAPKREDAADLSESECRVRIMEAIDWVAPSPNQDEEESLKAHTLGELYSLYDEWERQPWVWEGILPASSLSLIVGKSETGKSTIICGSINAIAKGLSFFGRMCRQGRVLYLAADPGSEFVAARTFGRLGLNPQDEVRTVIGALVGRRDGFRNCGESSPTSSLY